jgi:hypothetical protein
LQCLTLAGSPQPLNVQVTLRGHQYQLDNVVTAEDVQHKLSEILGPESPKQADVMFGSKTLESHEVLSDAGVSSGDILQIVPTSMSDAMQDYLKSAGIDADELENMMKSMGDGSGEMPSMKESLDMMNNMMNSPIFQEYMNDPEKLEQSRQMILQNPMLKSMMAGMPGMEDLLNDPVAWREAMQAAASLYKNMDSNQLMKAMMGNADVMPGLFDSPFDNSATVAALDELDEDD